MTHVFTESTVVKAMEMIQRRNSLVQRVEEIKDQIRPLEGATKGLLIINNKRLSVMVTLDVFDHLVKPFTDEIEKTNNGLKALGVVTVDEEEGER